MKIVILFKTLAFKSPVIALGYSNNRTNRQQRACYFFTHALSDISSGFLLTHSKKTSIGANKNTITLLSVAPVVSIIIACFFEGHETFFEAKKEQELRIWKQFSICFIKTAILISITRLFGVGTEALIE